ncbi:MAG: hypothetical protein FD143_2718 [Ignavibacteria bacterium]|nr:MAG: hypothetical protein FD143_2718 [Ignavibacteria bacterium]KAF0157796.1 MAG: hypothetical protein FD188_2674 [Ignavibacteria bacterium]
MKKSFLIFVVLVGFGIINSVRSQEEGYGFGIMLGEPTGLSAKYWLDGKKALNFGLAYSFVTNANALAVHCDYVFHNNNLVTLPVYYGFGARIRAGGNDNSFLGARGVVGVLYQFPKEPVDVFAEVAPVFNLFPKTTLHIDIAIGTRYFFR